MFDVRNLEREAAPASIVVTAPPGYTFAHVDPSDWVSIVARPAGGGPEQHLDPTLGAPTAVSMCVPGKHDLTWDAHTGNLSIPFAVDRTTASTRLIVCLDAVRAMGLRITEVVFSANFRAPAKAGLYRFAAVVAPSAGPEYELRAYTVLPLRLTTEATYSTETQTLTVRGRLLGDNKPWARRAVWVHTSPNGQALGTVVTQRRDVCAHDEDGAAAGGRRYVGGQPLRSRVPWQVLCARRVQERVVRQHSEQRCRGSSPWSRSGLTPSLPARAGAPWVVRRERTN